MKWLELRVPPVAVGLIIGLLMWLVARYMPHGRFDVDWKNAAAAAIAVFAIVVGVSGVWAFRRRETTVHPMRPEKTTSLVREGVFRYTRNPMYLGLALLLAAWGLFLASAAALVLVLVFIVYMTLFQILPEERTLREKFGREYEAYLASTRRWL